MNTFSTFWSRRRNRVIAATVGAGLAAAAVVGLTVSDSATADSAGPAAAAVVPAAAMTPSTAATTDAAHLRAAMRGIRALPAAQRPAAFLQLKTDVLAGKYGAKAKHDLAAIDAVIASDPAGLRGALLRLAAAHPHPHHAKASSSSTPAPLSTAPTT